MAGDSIRRRQRALRLTLEREGRAEVFLAGISMTPLLAPGRKITLEQRAPRKGEVVVYETRAGWIAHRVLAVSRETLLTRADRPGAGIERIRREKVVGVWTSAEGDRALGLRAPVGRAVQRVSFMLSGARVLPALRQLRREVRARLPRPQKVGLRELTEVGPADIAGLSALHLWHRSGVTPDEAGSHFWVLEASGRARGGLRVDLPVDLKATLKDRQGIIQIEIEPVLQGRGFGRALVHAAVIWARNEGLSALHAEIARDNRASRGLFLSAGFSRVGRKVAVSFSREAVIDAYRLDLGLY